MGIRVLFTAVIFLVLATGEGQAKTAAPLENTTVFIIRHAEKPDQGMDLSPAGVKRAQAYPAFFRSFKDDSGPVKIDHLFAAQESKNSNRSVETLLPLSDALRLKIHSNFALTDRRELVGKVGHHYRGQTVLICWHHGDIPNLLKALGVKPKALLPGGKWPEDVFGWLIELRYDQQGNLRAHVYNEKITPDDARHPPPST